MATAMHRGGLSLGVGWGFANEQGQPIDFMIRPASRGVHYAQAPIPNLFVQLFKSWPPEANINKLF